MRTPLPVFTNLHDDRYRFDRYWERLDEVDVPTPATRFVELDDTDGGSIPDCPTERVLDAMKEMGVQQAFVRSGFKAAVDRFRDGSFVSRRAADTVEETVTDLLTQHKRRGIPHGGIVVVREWLDLDYCMHPPHSHATEVRYFIKDGEVLSQTGCANPAEAVPDCPMQYSYVANRLPHADDPHWLAKRVAEAFAQTDLPWSVDVVLDAHGDWWVTEMHVDGVYWNDEKESWWNVCGHGDIEPWSPRWMHAAAIDGIRPD